MPQRKIKQGKASRVTGGGRGALGDTAVREDLLRKTANCRKGAGHAEMQVKAALPSREGKEQVTRPQALVM